MVKDRITVIYPGVVYKSCLTTQHLNGLRGLISDNVTWNSNWAMYPDTEYIRNIMCDDTDRKVACRQICPVYKGASNIVFYDNCEANLYAAFRRQCTATIPPDPEMVQLLAKFIDDKIKPEVESLLIDFKYSYNIWFNHLNAQQQNEMIKIESMSVEELYKQEVKIFCKSEKQIDNSSEPPKNRCISAFNEEDKYVMGPVVYALEQYFKKYDGYCGGKNWEELALEYDEIKRRHHKVIQTDVSGWDRSISITIKKFFSVIFDIVAPHVYHVPTEVFVKHYTAILTKLSAITFTDGKQTLHGIALIMAQVFSGRSDTTYSNSQLNATIFKFILELLIKLLDYTTKSKGDDNVSTVPEDVNNANIKEVYYQVFVPAKFNKFKYAPIYYKHGLGITLKYLTVGSTTDIDFCSTATFYCNVCGTHKITRQLERFITLLPWSSKTVSMTHKDTDAFKQQLYLSNLKWMNGLPIFRTLNDKLRTEVYVKNFEIGKPRITRQLNKQEQEWCREFLDMEVNATFIKYSKIFGKSDAYSMIQRQQNIKNCCIEACKEDFLDKYNWNKEDIEQIEKDINDSTYEYDSPTLLTGLAYFEMRKSLITLSD